MTSTDPRHSAERTQFLDQIDRLAGQLGMTWAEMEDCRSVGDADRLRVAIKSVYDSLGDILANFPSHEDHQRFLYERYKAHQRRNNEIAKAERASAKR